MNTQRFSTGRPIQLVNGRSMTRRFSAWALFLGLAYVSQLVAEDLSLAAVGTGRTTGHIATVSVTNHGHEPADAAIGPAYIPSSGGYQGYVVPRRQTVRVPPGRSARISVKGYCSDVRRLPVPAGVSMPSPEAWIPSRPLPSPDEVIMRSVGPYRPRAPASPGDLTATIPGTDEPIPFAVDVNRNPYEAAPYLLAAAAAIEQAYDRLVREGRIQTPFSADRDRERDAVVQQTLWAFSSRLQDEPYEKEHFQERLEGQFEERSGRPLEEAPPSVQKQISEGADDFWDTFSLVGAEAKVMQETAGDEGVQVDPEAVPVEAGGCTPETSIDHSDARADVSVSESYGAEEDRTRIAEAIRQDVSGDGDTFETSTPPATAYAIWRRDTVGGIVSAYAKTVFLKDDGQDWVWSTEELNVNASGNGVHTLSFSHGPDCSAAVTGVALMRLRAASEAFDPMERNIEAFRVLNAIKDLSLELSLRRVPPGLSDAIEAGADAVTDPSSQTYAVARGEVTLTVGEAVAEGSTESRVDYVREGQEDSGITGGGTVVEEFMAADTQPDSLTSAVEAAATMTAAASGNGNASADLESLYATVLIGICECPTGIRFKILTDLGLLIRSKAAAGAARVARGDLQALADAIAEDVSNGDLETDGDTLRERLEKDLKEWADHAGEGRFAMASDEEE